jgi:hypothetical protein
MVEMLRHLPFTSVDNSNWVQYAKTGQVVIPIYANGHPDYSLRPDKITVSDRGQARLRRNHIDRIDSFRRAQAERFIGEEVDGVTLEQMRPIGNAGKSARMRVCIKFFMEQAAIIGTPLFFVTNIDRVQQQALSQGGASTRLLSFAELQNKRPTALADYKLKAVEDAA